MEPISSNMSDKSPKSKHFVRKQTKEIIWNVYKYLKENKVNFKLTNLMKSVVEATGFSKSTVARVVRVGKGNGDGDEEASSSFSNPKKKAKQTPKWVPSAEFGEEAIRRIIHQFHVTHQERPTMKAVYERVVEDDTLDFKLSMSSFRRLIAKIGFSWKKSSDNKQILMERNNIKCLRLQYIRTVKKYREEGRPIIYTGETYFHNGHAPSYEWMDGSTKSSKGPRLIVVHAGGENGFIENALLIFKSGQKTGDYNDDMNFSNYKRWLEDQLIPNLPPRSVLVVDNASYHNVLQEKHPTASTIKEDMIKWLNERGIVHDVNLTKVELCHMIRLNKPQYNLYSIDGILAQHGHTVCRLPPYHPELNPIEKIWHIVKNWVALHNVNYQSDTVEQLTRDQFAEVGQAVWADVCRNVQDIEAQYIIDEHIMDEFHDRVVINLGDDSYASDDFDYFSSDDDEY